MSTRTLDHAPSRPPAALPRYAMAACAVLAPALTIAGLLAHTDTAWLEGRELVEAIAADPGAFTADTWLGPIATLLWVPAILAVGRVARARAGGIGLIGLILAFALALPLAAEQNQLAYLAVRGGLDVDATTALLDAAGTGAAALFGWSFLVGLLGLVLLGAAILRGRSAPWWTGVTLIVAAVGMVPSWQSGSIIAIVATWTILLIGFAGCAATLATHPGARE
ncbi:hypothetical protein DI005_17765 [Prauserella sp. PE36]|uniref:DUF4386 family protein n=1 Tax=Prauserella endophytica TaxID=1592324 RepID=A0ABY2S477_9PSEU|nr:MULTISPECIES: hypothetical protein [Prauserella]PXY23275.1 hypothetical protein BAY59_26680 [Prauserella coralliicola]RBM18868.1 hypothetical protein DI005_17765 [Prauserella sp. PE36]TKG70609.1 hypothetical protein FCN18_17205 [Prauserella endophytica]